MKNPHPYTQSQFLSDLKTEFTRCHAISTLKNKDYATDADPFANFRTCEQLEIASTEAGILTRMLDKFKRVANLTKPGATTKVSDESIEDTLRDLANYSMILLLYLRQKNTSTYFEPESQKEPDPLPQRQDVIEEIKPVGRLGPSSVKRFVNEVLTALYPRGATMLTESEVVESVLQACPSLYHFPTATAQHVRAWGKFNKPRGNRISRRLKARTKKE